VGRPAVKRSAANDATLWDAIDHGHASAESAAAHADERWRARAEFVVRSLPPGTEFLAEDIRAELDRQGATTADNRALGGVLLDLSRRGMVELTGSFRRARTSHGAPKPLWRRRG
jgi:hypothetical protein